MKVLAGTCVFCLALFGWAGPVRALDDSSARAAAVASDSAGDLYGNLDKIDFRPSCNCCDIAYMDTFGSNRLQYARTPEFLEAVRLVASGESKYSPTAVDDIPFAQWRAFAADMRKHSEARPSVIRAAAPPAAPSGVGAGPDGLSALHDRDCMIPALIYLASLEYRSKSGNGWMSPIYPRVLRAAAAELDARLADKRRMAERFARRAAAIRSTIAEAERAAEKKFSRDELARAISELEAACRDALGVRVGLLETDAAFARAEKIALSLLKR